MKEELTTSRLHGEAVRLSTVVLRGVILVAVAAGTVSPVGATSLVLAAEAEKLAPVDIKRLADQAKTLAGYFSGAKGAYGTGVALAEALGLIDTEDTGEKLDKISEQLDSIFAGVTWQASKAFIDNQRGPAVAAIRSLQRTGTAFPGGSVDQDSANAAQTLRLSDVPFYRPHNEKVTDGPWKDAIEYGKDELLPQAGGSLVWDWRLGMPALLEVISYRLLVIAALEPEFRDTGLYDVELEDYRATLEKYLSTMLAGVRCGLGKPSGTALPRVAWACADIRTGIYAGRQRIVGETPGTDEQILSELRGQVVRAMPLFEVRAMLDTLYFYQHGGQDLTELRHQISVRRAPGLCLDVQWGNPAAGTPVWLWPCDGNVAQRWVYDRRSGTIRNPAFDKCLDVQHANAKLGTPVWTWDCNGTDAQRWTYDYRTGVLENAVGTVLDIQWGDLAAETPVWSWGRNEGDAQRWKADQAWWLLIPTWPFFVF